MKKAGRSVTLQLNGRPTRLANVPDPERLLDTLRWRAKLKGTKEGCRTGDCGACTVLVDGRTTLSCLTLTHEVNDRRILTIEGAPRDARARKVIAAFEAETALQCGYCTPGFIMALTGLLSSKPRPRGIEELLEDLQGNLCRCTGYGSIRRAAERLLPRSRS
jgi:aerobic carbon-monoxide dehydrogenase small subunit